MVGEHELLELFRTQNDALPEELSRPESLGEKEKEFRREELFEPGGKTGGRGGRRAKPTRTFRRWDRRGSSRPRTVGSFPVIPS